MFDKIKDLYHFQKQARQIKKDLKNIHIEAEVDGVTVIIDGEQEVVTVTVAEEALKNPRNMQDSLVKAFNKAVKKSQQIAAEKMKPVMSGMGMPGAS